MMDFNPPFLIEGGREGRRDGGKEGGREGGREGQKAVRGMEGRKYDVIMNHIAHVLVVCCSSLNPRLGST